MSNFSRRDVYRLLYESGIVPVFYHPDADVCKGVARACYDGGVRAFEFTDRGSNAPEVFAALADFARKELPGMALGAGTVTDPGTASAYLRLGADFIVSPVLLEDVMRVCQRRKKAVIPGCATLTEIVQAQEWGAEIVKIFPAASLGGPGFLRAILGPVPEASVMPTGGIEPEEAIVRDWIEAGAWCLGMGSALLVKTASGWYDLGAIEKNVRDAIHWVHESRPSTSVPT